MPTHPSPWVGVKYRQYKRWITEMILALEGQFKRKLLSPMNNWKIWGAFNEIGSHGLCCADAVLWGHWNVSRSVCWAHVFSWKEIIFLGACMRQYRHREFQFPLWYAVHLGTESEHQVLNGSHIFVSITRVLLFLVCIWRHGGHVGVQNNGERSLLGIWFYYYTKLERHFVSSRECNPRIAWYQYTRKRRRDEEGKQYPIRLP